MFMLMSQLALVVWVEETTPGPRVAEVETLVSLKPELYIPTQLERRGERSPEVCDSRY